MKIEAKGYLGSLTFDGKWLTISHPRYSAAGRTSKRVHVRDLGPVNLVPAGFGQRGFIRFSLLGEVTSKHNRHRRQISEIESDANAVMFYRKHQPEFEALEQAIAEAMSAAR